MTKNKAGRPRRALRPGEDPVNLNIARLKDSLRYYTDDPVVRWARGATSEAKRRALRAGVPFAITSAMVLAMAGPVCPALGLPLSYARGRAVVQDDSATLDRIIPTLGYVEGNVQVISNKANRMKSDATPEEVARLSRWMSRPVSTEEVMTVT